jgi:hypothetical protein
MEQKIYKEGNNLKIELSIPLTTNRYNPYMGDDPVGTMDNIIGVIAGNDIGFSYLIDMDYKGKDDQISTLFYLYEGEEDEFKKLCQSLGISYYEYPICDYCNKPIYGCFALGEKGNMCFDCEIKSRR